MADKRRLRAGNPAPPDDAAQDVPSAEASWEERALARVRPHLQRLKKEGVADPAGWETDTLTRLEGYFDRQED
jgi:hypothetical protein